MLNQINQITNILRCCTRNYATKKQINKKLALLQDPEQIPVYDFPRSSQTDHRVYVWGLSETGALGIQKSLKKQSMRHTAFIQHPTRLQFAEITDVLDVTSGYGFSAFAVKSNEDFSLFGTGINTDSQIGFHKHGGETNRPIELLIYPAPINLPKTTNDEKIQIIKCAAGRAHLLALSETGVVYSLGNNSYGQCGRKIVENENYMGNQTVHRIENLSENDKIISVECGQDHSMFLTNNGKVFSCGWSADGQTGLGHYNSVYTPSLIGGDISRERIVKLACTADCVLGLNDKGEVFGWGNAEYGQLECIGDNQQLNLPQFIQSTKGLGKIIDIASGGSNCCILNENGDVFVWGYGILGFGPNVEHLKTPKQIPATLFGRNEFNPNLRVTSIYSGISHIGAINDEDDLFMWGRNKFGCLGLGHKNDQFFPFKTVVGAKVYKISCGVDHTLALCKPFI